MPEASSASYRVSLALTVEQGSLELRILGEPQAVSLVESYLTSRIKGLHYLGKAPREVALTERLTSVSHGLFKTRLMSESLGPQGLGGEESP